MYWKYGIVIETDSPGRAVVIEMPLAFSAFRRVTYTIFVEVEKNGLVTILIFKGISGTK